jgi:protein O-GlcNAc transferase
MNNRANSHFPTPEAELAEATRLHLAGDLVGAERLYLSLKRRYPNHPPVLHQLALIAYQKGYPEPALRALQPLVAAHPGFADAWNSLGLILTGLLRHQEALSAFEEAHRLRPTHPETCANLGVAFSSLRRFAEAEKAFQQGLANDELFPGLHYNLGNLYQDMSRHEEAISCFRRALELAPNHVGAYKNLLSTLLYADGLNNQAFAQENQRLEALLAKPLYAQAFTSHNTPPEPERRLRIGYLSSDLREHSVARNLLPLIENHDRKRFFVALYSLVSHPDAMTKRFRQKADLWRSVAGLNDLAIAQQIHTDRIDILVVLAGRFDANHPLVAALRPVPLQISFHDPATSGLAAMDYLIADPVLVPRNGGEYFAERVLRLPSFYLAASLTEQAPLAPPPLIANGFPTFACFNNPTKLTESSLSLWARVLEALPQARLLLRYKDYYADNHSQERVLAILTRGGAKPEQVQFATKTEPRDSHLSHYNQADIALDSFPFCGSTTSFEALWMGLPVVTLPADRMVGRWTASMLHALKLDELVAADAEEYVAICRRLAGDGEYLSSLRMGLRQRLARSPLCHARARTGQIERLYRAIWRRWCSTRPEKL